MKAFIIFLLLVIGAIAFYLFGPTSSPPQPAQSTPQQQQQQQQVQQAKPTSTIREDIDSAMGYGTGYTQMKIKKSSQSKLDKISQTHNQKIEGTK